MTPPRAFRAAAHAMFTRFYPDHGGGVITVHLHGADVVVPIPAAVDKDAPGPLTPMQDAILEVLKRAAGEDPMTGDDLAEAAGYDGASGAWRRAIADLILRGYIENCRPGYRLRTEATA